MKSSLDYAMMKYGGSYLDTDVEEVKTMGRVMVIFAIFIPYWAIYFQVQLVINFLHYSLSSSRVGLCHLIQTIFSSVVIKSHLKIANMN